MTDSSIIENLRELVRVSFFFDASFVFASVRGGGGISGNGSDVCWVSVTSSPPPQHPRDRNKKKKKSRVGRSTGTRPAHGRFARTGKLASKIETTALAHRFVIGSKLRRGKNV